MTEDKELSVCPECGEKFDNSFDYVDHLLEDDEDFDPALILPGGYQLMVGSLLYGLYKDADNPKKIRDVVQSVYITLFTAETQTDLIGRTIEDIIVEGSMLGIDDELNKLLKDRE